MRKYLALLLILLAGLATACGGGETTPTDAPAVEPTPTEEAEAAATEDTEGTLALTVTEEPEADATAEAVTVNSALEPWVCPEGFEGQQLSVYNWATYIGDNTVADFEAACGVTVLYDIYDTDEAMITRLRQGNPGYDVAFPTDYAVSIMIREELVQPIDLANIPNFSNIATEFTNQPFDPNNVHSVPYVWGTTGIAYNRNNVTTPITSWEEFFTFEGRVAWIDVPRIMIGAALEVLGYDPNSTNPEEIEAAKQYLIENSANVITIAGDDGDSLLVQGEVDAVVEYGGDVHQQIVDCACDDYVYVLPSEGAIRDITSIVLLADAPNPALGMVFMDYILHPQVGADITNTIAYPSPNRVAIEQGLISPELMSEQTVNPDQESIANMFFINDIGDADRLYNDAWDEIKVSIGQ